MFWNHNSICKVTEYNLPPPPLHREMEFAIYHPESRLSGRTKLILVMVILLLIPHGGLFFAETYKNTTYIVYRFLIYTLNNVCLV